MPGQSFGIIDRDRRPASDIVKLNSKNIWVLDVAEAENILLEENIVKAVADHIGRNADDTFNQDIVSVLPEIDSSFTLIDPNRLDTI